jgi:hypothetical protein
MTTPAFAFGAAAESPIRANAKTINKLAFFIFVASQLHQWKHGEARKVAAPSSATH